MLLTVAAATVIVETTWAAYGEGLASDAAIGLAVTIIDNYALKGCDHMKESWGKRHEKGVDTPKPNDG